MIVIPAKADKKGKNEKLIFKSVKYFIKPDKNKITFFAAITMFHIIIDYLRFINIIPYDILLKIYYTINFIVTPFFSISNFYVNEIFQISFAITILVHLIYWYILACAFTLLHRRLAKKRIHRR